MKIIVVGAGLAGLSCANKLTAAGLDIELYEASDRVGGRVRTDHMDGFTLDHGFQVLQTGYPAARTLFDYQTLDLQPFESGAMVQTESGRYTMADPWRSPSRAIQTLFNPVGSILDRWKLYRLRCDALRFKLNARHDNDCSIVELLAQRYRFSSDFINRFLRPWISGMFFDEELATSAAFFQFIFQVLATADAALPAGGIERLAIQLCDKLPADSIRLNSPVRSVGDGSVTLADGTRSEGDFVVIATEPNVASQLLGRQPSRQILTDFASTMTLYFSAEEPPPIGRFLVLNGSMEQGKPRGPINNIAVLSNVAPTYAPRGQSLISVSLRSSWLKSRPEPDDKEAVTAVLHQAREWFGSSVSQWRLIQQYFIEHAVPRLLPGRWDMRTSARVADRTYLCGDSLSSPSLQGALESGERAANEILNDHRSTLENLTK